MRLEWINNKIITAAAVLTFSCVAAAAYTAVQEAEMTSDVSISDSYQGGFVFSLLEAEASLYELDPLQTRQAKLHLSQFFKQAQLDLNSPDSQGEVALRTFALHADRLIQASFPLSREVLSVTEALAQQQGTPTLNTWLLLSTARQFDIEATLSLQQDHAHVVLKTEGSDWLDWKVGHLQDMQSLALNALDDYDLWTAVDLALVEHYMAAQMSGNDDSIEALAKAAVLDGYSSQALALYNEFLVIRGRSSELAMLMH
jgi:hypothetical protein